MKKPRAAGDRVKTDRKDAELLVRLLMPARRRRSRCRRLPSRPREPLEEGLKRRFSRSQATSTNLPDGGCELPDWLAAAGSNTKERSTT
jgi:transposase